MHLPFLKNFVFVAALAAAAKETESEKREEEKEKRELRSPDGTEPETDVGVARVVDVALRATAVAGDVEPDAAAQQTIRASRGSCGVGHAS